MPRNEQKQDLEARRLIDQLADHLLRGKGSSRPAEIQQQQIQKTILTRSSLLDGPNFSRLSSRALLELFHEYDQRFFMGKTMELVKLRHGTLDFRLSQRMTRTGGKTTRVDFHQPTVEGHWRSYEITISSHLLFQAFRSGQPVESVSGVRCRSRIEALQRIFEHEMLHLIEMLLWVHSSCSEPRFMGMAQRLFGHTESTHQLPTHVEVAKKRYGLAPGHWVRFDHEGQALKGFINRIGRRATVLVEHPGGEMYSDGVRYRKYYVPLNLLTRLPNRSR